ncbi:MAG: hypothetical protein A2589_00385 [Candidatus Vogelbacteria bacterium RIFOXYD1_FULL_46_19]|uniref:Membrane insertase YidC/Oxa/ALB C-terminal domain-containing protein n=1 Tax=Candidatus Vogelbacteria bacterium RIFOXYD1_FULL_46_19 TaxID=1802439 RepID=A0A1G2QHL7_9BACT|nr:MAG: hypothetical protein A2589_00385 [Candidatus Vogelbacteria bacterium RIFOXYD1_FULL_46_19]
MIGFFNIILFQPLYNALVWLSGVMPGHSIALAIIALTVIIKTLLTPLYHKSSKTQRKLKEIEPELSKLKEQHKDDKQLQAQKMMELYREHGINPLTGFMVLLIQLPIILALFYVFSKGFELNLDILYPFVSSPEVVDRTVFGWILLTEKSYWLALLVGLTQYVQIRLTLPPLPQRLPKSDTPSFKEDLARSMNMQMRYVMPVIITVIASQFPSAIALYWLTGNLFAIGHELIVRSKAKKLVV